VNGIPGIASSGIRSMDPNTRRRSGLRSVPIYGLPAVGYHAGEQRVAGFPERFPEVLRAGAGSPGPFHGDYSVDKRNGFD